MEQTILNQEQNLVLDAFAQNRFLTDTFYFSDGTALSEVYLKHRQSIDLDFFTDTEYESQKILNILVGWSKIHKFTITPQFADPTHIYILHFPNGKELKVDFALYPYRQLAEKLKYRGSIKVDSLMDIAANKMVTLTQRAEVKDYVDVYFLLQKFTFWDMKSWVRTKFNIELDLFNAAADFAAVENFEFLPDMISPLSLSELKKFFLVQAQKLGADHIDNS